jgi:DUF4097 and DUF4098 domain-containing protein YvlB
VTVPDAGAVTVDTSNGAIAVRGTSIAGNLDLRTSNGRIQVDTASPGVVLRTSNGSVRVRGTHERVEAESSNGAVDAVVTGAGPARIRTSNGSVRLEVTGAYAGALDVSTSNGTVSFPGLEGREGVRVERESKREARLTLGSGGSESTVRSSNGDVVVTNGR